MQGNTSGSGFKTFNCFKVSLFVHVSSGSIIQYSVEVAANYAGSGVNIVIFFRVGVFPN